MQEPKQKPTRARRTDGILTRTKILDAAEHLFTYSGYNGTTTREVALRAGVPLGVLGYHVGSKDDLFREVINRRAHLHVAEVEACLAAVAHQNPRDIEAVIRAYFTPSTEWFMRGDVGQRNYVTLIARSMSLPYYEDFLQPLATIYDPVVKLLYKLVHDIFPDASLERSHWAIYFLQAIYIHLITQSKIVDRQSSGLCQSSDLDVVLDELTPFLAAAFTARLSPVLA